MLLSSRIICDYLFLDAELKKREQNDEDEEDIVEDYDVWKQRILEEAYKMLEKKG